MPMTSEQKLDKFRGCLVGLAVGDALGAPVEAWSPHLIRMRLGAVDDYLDSVDGMNAHKLKRGEWTDDTLMALALARGLIKASAENPKPQEILWKIEQRERLIELVAAEHLADWKTDPKNGCYGKATREALKALEQGTSWRRSGSLRSPGNGVAMRIAPTGLWFSEIAHRIPGAGFEDPWLAAKDQNERCLAEQVFFNLMRLTYDLGLITHQGNTALSCGVLQAYLTLKFYRRGESAELPDKAWQDLIWKELNEAAELLVAVLGCGTELVAMLRSAKTKGQWRTPSDIIAGIGSGFTAVQSCAIAWIMAIMNADDLRFGILAAVNAGGDADTVGAMTGALLGAKFGFSGIPENWVMGLDRHDEIVALADKLFKTTG